MKAKNNQNQKIVSQCLTCPWLQNTTVANIPNYNCALHEGLRDTINEGETSLTSSTKMMSCHYQSDGETKECAGHLQNQAVNNNLGVRIYLIRNNICLRLAGEQVGTFDDTFK